MICPHYDLWAASPAGFRFVLSLVSSQSACLCPSYAHQQNWTSEEKEKKEEEEGEEEEMERAEEEREEGRGKAGLECYVSLTHHLKRI